MPCLTDIVDDLKKQVRRLSNGDRKFETSTPSRSSSCSSFSRPSSPDVTVDKLYNDFCNGKFDDDPIEYDNRHALSSYVKVGASKSISSLTKVSPCSSVIDVGKSLGPFVMSVVPSNRPVLHAAGVTNAFSVLMKNARTKSRSLPPQFSEQRHPQNSKLKNDILQWLESKGLGWSPDAVQSLGCTFVNTIADTMWYIDQNHATLAS